MAPRQEGVGRIIWKFMAASVVPLSLELSIPCNCDIGHVAGVRHCDTISESGR